MSSDALIRRAFVVVDGVGMTAEIRSALEPRPGYDARPVRVDVWRGVDWVGQWRWHDGFTDRLSGRKRLTHAAILVLEQALRAKGGPS